MTPRVLLATPSVCSICGARHMPSAPHDARSPFYQYQFWLRHARWPTLADAVAHCPPMGQRSWREHFEELGEWTEPPEGVQPIAEKGVANASP